MFIISILNVLAILNISIFILMILISPLFKTPHKIDSLHIYVIEYIFLLPQCDLRNAIIYLLYYFNLKYNTTILKIS